MHALDECDILVRLLDNLDRKKVPAVLATGSRLWETGYVYARGKLIVPVGKKKQCMFDWLPSRIMHVRTKGEAKKLLIEFTKEKRTWS